jgi:hypothetical protein
MYWDARIEGGTHPFRCVVLSSRQGPEANSPRLDNDQMTKEVLGVDSDRLHHGFGLCGVRQTIELE